MSKMPVWLAPILGAIVAGALGFYVGKFEMNFEPPSILPWFVLGSALVGALAGLILWFIDSRRMKESIRFSGMARPVHPSGPEEGPDLPKEHG